MPSSRLSIGESSNLEEISSRGLALNSDLLGIVLAASASFVVALNGAFGSKYLKKLEYGPASANFVSLVAGTLIALVFVVFSQEIYAISKLTLIVIAVFVAVGVIQNAIARRLWFVSLRHVGSNQANTLVASEGLYSIILAIVFLQERLTAILGIGAALILIAIFLVEVKGSASVREGSAKLGYIAGISSAVFFGTRQVLVSYGLSLFPHFILSIVIAYSSGLLAHVIIERPTRIAGQLRKIPSQAIRVFIIIGVLTVLTQFLTFSSLGISQVVFFAPIFSTYPVFTILLSRLTLGGKYEVLGPRTILSVVMVVTGAVLVSLSSIL